MTPNQLRIAKDMCSWAITPENAHERAFGLALTLSAVVAEVERLQVEVSRGHVVLGDIDDGAICSCGHIIRPRRDWCDDCCQGWTEDVDDVPCPVCVAPLHATHVARVLEGATP